MAFLKYANAVVKDIEIKSNDWNQVRSASNSSSKSSSEQFQKSSSMDLGEYSDPSKYLLSHCFPSGHMILMEDGTEKPIEDIKVGDRVITHKGRSRRVTKLFRKEVEEDLVSIKPAHSREITSTGNHPFFTLSKEDTWCSVFPSYKGNVKCTFGGKKSCKKYDCKCNNNEGFKWKDASNLGEGDILLFPRVTESVISSDLSKDRLRLLGYYIAEGRVDKDCNKGEPYMIRFTLHKDEEATLGQEIKDLMASEFGIDTYSRIIQKQRGDRAVTLSFHSFEHAPWFLKHSGIGSRTKKLSLEVMQSPVEWQKEMVSTWMNGDGCYDRKGGIRLVTSSLNLATQSKVLFNRMKIHMNPVRVTPNEDWERKEGFYDYIPQFNGWHLTVPNSFCHAFAETTKWEIKKPKRYCTKERFTPTGKDYGVLSSIKGVERNYFKGFVYNFSVEEDESYVVNGKAVHNCTIIASVDVEEVPNVKTGEKVREGSTTINRPYKDYYITPETAKFINCFEAGTQVTMGDGTIKNIENIQVGDEVITHKGRVRKVTKTFENDYEGDILDIKIRGTNNRISTTPEHPFFVYEANEECVECGKGIERNTKSDSHLLGRHYCSKWCYYEKGASNKSLLKEKTGTFLEAGELTPKHHFATQPIIPIDVYDTGLTKGQARLIGYFLAEGFYELDSLNDNSKVGVKWAFHENERHTLAKNVVELMESEFGVQCVIRDSSENKGIYVTTRTNRDMVSFFQKWVKGDKSVTKHLHPQLLQESSDIIFEILRGWFEGDGSFFIPNGEKIPRLEGTSASYSLINQIHQVLNSLKISSRRSYRKRPGRVRDPVTGSVVNDPSTTLDCGEILVGFCEVSELIKDTIYEGLFDVEVQKASSHRFINDYCVQMITEIETRSENTKVYNIEVEDDHSYLANGFAVHNCNGDGWQRDLLLGTYRTFIGAENYVEHIQIPDLSKGKVIDAVARDLGDTVYVDILVATNRKHKELIADIESGKINTLSMGCSIQFSTCTKCGNVAADETELCPCVKYEKGNKFVGKDGKQHVVAELCGHPSDLESVTFIEASWVANPAFKGAVLRNILNPNSDITEEERAETAKKQSELIASSPMMAEFLESQNLDKFVRTAAKEVLGQELESIKELREQLNQKVASTSKKSFGFDDEEDDDGEGDEEQGSPIEEMKDEIKNEIHKNLKKEITEDMKDELGLGPREKMFDGNSGKPNVNDNILQGFQAFSSRYASEIGSRTKLRKVFTVLYEAKEQGWNRVASLEDIDNTHIVAAMYLKDRDYGKHDVLPPVFYECLVKVGGSSNYSNLNAFINACHLALGRKTSSGEAQILVKRSKFLK